MRKAAARVDIAAPSATAGRSTIARPVGTPAPTASTASAIAGIDWMARSGADEALIRPCLRGLAMALGWLTPHAQGGGRPLRKLARAARRRYSRLSRAVRFPGERKLIRLVAVYAGARMLSPGTRRLFLAELRRSYIPCVNFMRAGWLAQRGCFTPVLHGAGSRRSRLIRCWQPRAQAAGELRPPKR